MAMLIEAREIYHHLRTNLLIQWSWGFANPKSIGLGLQFEANGLSFQGIVRIRKNHETGCFTLFFINSEGKQVRKIWDVEKDSLISILQNNIDNADGGFWRNFKEVYVVKRTCQESNK